MFSPGHGLKFPHSKEANYADCVDLTAEVRICMVCGEFLKVH